MKDQAEFPFEEGQLAKLEACTANAVFPGKRGFGKQKSAAPSKRSLAPYLPAATVWVS